MRTSEGVALAIVAVSFIIAINLYQDMPEMMPSHWNAAGEVDGYLPKLWALFLMPAITVGILALFAGLPRIPSLSANIRGIRKEYDAFTVIIIGFFFYIYLLTILWVFELQFGIIRMLVPAFAVMIYSVGLLVKNVKRNKYIGIRTPWTLGSDRVWDKTHKLAAKLYKAAGLASLLGLLFEGYFALAFLIGPVIIVSAYAIIYSYFEHKNEKGMRR